MRKVVDYVMHNTMCGVPVKTMLKWGYVIDGNPIACGSCIYLPMVKYEDAVDKDCLTAQEKEIKAALEENPDLLEEK